MSKKNLVLVLSLTLLLSFCGKKGDPVPKSILGSLTITDLRGEIKGGVLFLSFTPPQGVEGVRIFRRCGTCGAEFEHLRDISIVEGKGYIAFRGRVYFYDSDLLPGFLYSYRVLPLKKGREGPSSNTFSVVFEEPPPPPQGLSAEAQKGKVRLEWKNEDGLFYNVYRLDKGYPLLPLNVEPLTFPLFIDSDVIKGASYTYEVRSMKRAKIDVEGRGVRIRVEALDRTPPSIPQGLFLERFQDGIRLTWKKNEEDDLLGYYVYRVEGSLRKRLNDTPIKEERFVDADPPGLRYFSYFVTAVDFSGNESEPSKEVVLIREE